MEPARASRETLAPTARGIEATAGLTLLAPVTLTAVCFVLDGASQDRQTRLLATLAAENTALLGPVMLKGRHGIRACITNHRTTTDDVDLILTRLREVVAG